MSEKIILEKIDLDLGSNPPSGYKYLGFDGESLSERTGSTVSVIGGRFVPTTGTFKGTSTSEFVDLIVGPFDPVIPRLDAANGTTYITGIRSHIISGNDGYIRITLWNGNIGSNDDRDFKVGRYIRIQQGLINYISSLELGPTHWLTAGIYPIIKDPQNPGSPYEFWFSADTGGSERVINASSILPGDSWSEGVVVAEIITMIVDAYPITGNINMISQPTTLDSFSDLSLVTKKYVDDALIKPYKIYVALMTQTGTNAPTVSVLKNTLGGTLVWSYTNVGIYTGTLNGIFPDSTKAWLTIQQPSSTDSSSMIYYSTINTVIVSTGNSAGTTINSKITNTAIEIRVYD